MKRWLKVTLGLGAGAIASAVVALAVVTRSEAIGLVTNPVAGRKVSVNTPATRHMLFDDVVVTTADGLKLAGWFIPAGAPGAPAASRALIMVQHGYKDTLQQYLGVAELLHRHGYHVLLTSVRAHDRSDGDVVSFGYHEMKDLDAWYDYVKRRGDVDADHVGMIGVSMGGTIGILYAARNPHITALVANCAFSSLRDTIDTSVLFFTGLPPFPFAPMIEFWVRRQLDFDTAEIDAKKWIGRISPRPVLVMQGGADQVISPKSGELLYQAAGAPKEFWFDPELGHAEFFAKRPEEFERRIIGFFRQHLATR